MPSANYPRPRSEMTEHERAEWRLYSKTDVQGLDDCWEWQGATTSGGYAHIRGVDLYGERVEYPYGHRVSWALKHGRWPLADSHIMHTCDNPGCVNPNHLVEGTAQQNAQDRPRTGRWFGMGKGKLSDDQVRYVRTSSKTQMALAKELSTSQATICRVRQRESYKHVI